MTKVAMCAALVFGFFASATALAAESGTGGVSAGDAGLMLLLGIGLAARQLRRHHTHLRSSKLVGGFADPGR
jgi:hypothetical protein